MSKQIGHPDEAPAGCPVERALSIVGGKWTLLILHELMTGPRRFTELQRGLGSASPKVLTERLREMEQAGLLTRTAYAEVPPRVEYALTAQGHALQPIMHALVTWGETLPPKTNAA